MTTGEKLARILAECGQPGLQARESEQFEQYMALLLRWNARTNLSAIRDEEGILRRHFVESIGCARALPSGLGSLLDFGSGAGFPGIPCAICRPELEVTLAESQGKKAAFLREALRTLGVRGEVFAQRVESMEPGRRFDAVTLRAVDKMEEACRTALERLGAGGWLCVMTTAPLVAELAGGLEGVAWRAPVRLPGSEQGVVLLGRRLRG